jgi:hypothetical protein
VDEALYPSFARLLGYPLGRRDMHRMEGFCSALDVEADRVDDAKRPFNRRRDRLPLANIRGNGPKLQIIAAGSLRAPRGDANRKPLVTHMADDPAP